MKSKGILFISTMDLKDRSAQVLKKTIEAFRDAGWDVFFVVARDNSKDGSYYYEPIINLEGIHTIRFFYPLTSLKDKVRISFFKRILNRLVLYLVMIKLLWISIKVLKKNKNIKVIYAVGPYSVLVTQILKILGVAKDKKIVHRFFGTWINYYLETKNIFKLILNWEELIALWLKADLCIMTNDGSQGNLALKKIRSKSLSVLRFWVNGVDELKLPPEKINELKEKYKVNDKVVFLTMCRLVKWKRVDRALKVLEILKKKYKFNSFIYYIVGDGPERKNLEKLVSQLDLQNNVKFLGSQEYREIRNLLNIADIVLLTYDLTNVGNPLLESIRANKIIFTLNNGDTSKWIKHGITGFIYDLDKNLYEKMAKDIVYIIQNPSYRKEIINNIQNLEKEKLWTWKERLEKEIEEIEKLVRG